MAALRPMYGTMLLLFPVSLHSIYVLFVAPAVRQRDKPLCVRLVALRVQPARQISEIAPHHVAKRSCVRRRRR